jgi:hypothetical protein
MDPEVGERALALALERINGSGSGVEQPDRAFAAV